MCARVPRCVSCAHACSQEMSAYRASLSASWLTPLFKEQMSCAWRCWVCESELTPSFKEQMSCAWRCWVCESELTPFFKELMSCAWRAWPSSNRLIPSNRGFSSALRALESMLNIIDEKCCCPVHPRQDVSRLFCHLTMWLQVIFYHVQAVYLSSHTHTHSLRYTHAHARTRANTHPHTQIPPPSHPTPYDPQL